MPVNLISQVPQAIGTDRDYKLTILGPPTDGSPAGSPVTTLNGSEALAAQLWRGDDQAAAVAPALVFLDATAGTCKLTVSAANTTTLGADGYYQLRCTIAAAGRTKEFYRGLLQLAPSPGAATPDPSYCTEQQMLRLAPWLRQLQTPDVDQTGFAEQRGMARAWLDNLILARYRPPYWRVTVPNMQASNLFNFNLGAGDYPRDTWLASQLAANRLIVTPYVVEMTSYRAIHYVCQAQLSGARPSSYQELARYHFRMSESMVGAYMAEIDVSGNGYPGIFVRCGAASLR